MTGLDSEHFKNLPRGTQAARVGDAQGRPQHLHFSNIPQCGHRHLDEEAGPTSASSVETRLGRTEAHDHIAGVKRVKPESPSSPLPWEAGRLWIA